MRQREINEGTTYGEWRVAGLHGNQTTRSFCSRGLNLKDEPEDPTTTDYRFVLQEGKFHKRADSTIMGREDEESRVFI